MPFALGSFAGGLFQGAQSAANLYGMYRSATMFADQDRLANADAMARQQDTANQSVPGYGGEYADLSAPGGRSAVTPSNQSWSESIPGTDRTKGTDPAAIKQLAGASTPTTTKSTDAKSTDAKSTDAKSTDKEIDTSSLAGKINAGLKLAKKATTFISSGGMISSAPTPTTNVTGDSNPLATPTPGATPTRGTTPGAPATATPAGNADPALTDAQRRGQAPLPTFRSPPVSYDPAQGGTPMARGAVAGSGPGGMPTYDVPAEGYQPRPAASIGNRPSPYQAAPSLAPNAAPDQVADQVAPAAPAQTQPAGPPLTTSPFRARRGGDLIQREAAHPSTTVAAPEQAGPPVPPAQPGAGSPFRARRGGDVIQRQPAQGPAPLQWEDPNAWQPAQGATPSPAQVAPPQFEDPNAWQPVPGQPSGQPSGQPPPAQAPGWGAQILGHLNPMGRAEAAEPPKGASPDGLLPAQQDTPASDPPIAPPTAASPGATAPVADPRPEVKVAPGQTTPSTASETPAASSIPTVSIGPYTLVEQQRPDLHAKLTAAAKKWDVSPQEIAAHWYVESDMRTTVPADPTGANKAIGSFQIEPDTHKGLDRQAGVTRDPTNFDHNLDLAGQRIAEANAHYGRNTPASFVDYMRGERGAREISADPAGYLRDNPIVAGALAKAFPGVDLTQPGVFPKGGPVSAHAAVAAAATGGPDAFLKSIVATGPQPMGMTALWRNVEDQMIHLALRKGDTAGVYHAQDYVFQMSHAGALSNMMAADQAILAGDPTSAVQYLAKAHAFVPDNSFARFGIGSDNRIYAEQFDEGSGKPLGQRFEVTHEALAMQLMKSHDPKEYAKSIQEMQKANSEIALNNHKGNYYDQTGDARQEAVQQRADAAQAADETKRAAIEAANERAREHNETQLQIKQGQTQAQDHAIDIAATKAYGPESSDTMFTDPATGKAYTPARRQEVAGQAAAVYSDIRRTSAAAGAPVGDLPAQELTRKLLDGSARIKPQAGANAVVDERGQPLGFISDGLANRLRLAGAQPHAMNGPPISPVGAGGGSQLAAMSGLNANITGQPLQQMQA